MSIESVSTANLPDAAHSNHGRTRAAWVTNVGVTLGSLVAAWGFTFWDMTPVAIGGGVIVASLIAGGVLKALGHGQPSR
jgi:hypothetical protein